MQTNLAPQFKNTAQGQEAEAILRKCVHCGFCTATCPTYQVLGDELDSPRGRIYLMKQVLEGAEVTDKTRLHLDRCLTCRNCETTCPSGVEYGHLIDIGRQLVEDATARGTGEKLLRTALKEGLTSPLVAPAMAVGRAVKPLLPQTLKNKLPSARPAGAWPTRTHARKVLLLKGCVQPAMLPSIDAATARVLDALDIQSIVAQKSGCCGALRFHMNDQDGGLADMRRNIDAWWPLIESGQVEALVMNASGCGATVREYGHHLKHDAAYAQKAARVSELTQDLGEFLAPMAAELADKMQRRNGPHLQRAHGLASPCRSPGSPHAARNPHLAPSPLPHAGEGVNAVFHPPCTLQHWQKLKGVTEGVLAQCGVQLQPFAEGHLCCGSAGAYSMLQPEIATQLRDRKLANLQAGQPQVILSANIGCLTHLQSGTDTPVIHWIEWVDQALAARAEHAN
jgi:glycolate oxidase iron-sulfur subunit